MRRSVASKAPVVTLLSPSREASLRAKQFLGSGWSGLREPLVSERFHSHETDELNNWMASGVAAVQWDSVYLECARTGTIFHWLSAARKTSQGGPANDANEKGKDSGKDVDGMTSSNMALLAVQEADSIEQARNKLAESFRQGLTPFQKATLQFRVMLGLPYGIQHVLSKTALPILDLTKEQASAENTTLKDSSSLKDMVGIKELAIPAHDNATYQDGHTLFSAMASLPLARPVTGVYETAEGLSLRPLPSAKEDRSLSPVTLVFYSPHLDDTIKSLQTPLEGKPSMIRIAKIGYTGARLGQIMLRHPHLPGLDMRLCSSPAQSSMFAEAHEALLSSSLEELQSELVLGAKDRIDSRTNKMDCWVEFRASLANPIGFIRGAKRNHRVQKVEKLSLHE